MSNELSPGLASNSTPEKGESQEESANKQNLNLELVEELPEQNSIEDEVEEIEEEEEDDEDNFSFDSEQARLDMEKMGELLELGEHLKNGLDQKVSIV